MLQDLHLFQKFSIDFNDDGNQILE